MVMTFGYCQNFSYCQNFVSAHYLVNRLMELDQILHMHSGVILELLEREKFCDNIRISGRSFGPNFRFPYTFYIFSLLPHLNIGRRQPA